MSITLPSRSLIIKFQELKDLKGNGEYTVMKENHYIECRTKSYYPRWAAFNASYMSQICLLRVWEEQQQHIIDKNITDNECVITIVIIGWLMKSWMEPCYKSLVKIMNTCRVQFRVYQDKGEDAVFPGHPWWVEISWNCSKPYWTNLTVVGLLLIWFQI